MTTPEPRVRVRIWREEYQGRSLNVATWRCPACGERTYFGALVPLAQNAAHRHAATCPALRLAWLVRELETLRDRHADASRQWFDSIRPRSPDHAKGFRMGKSCALTAAASDLAALLGRMG